MPGTPDSKFGPSYEEGVYMTETSLATQAGEVRYASGRFSLYDSTGEYDPRSGSGLSEAQHRALRQLIHFIDEGPADGFASGAYKETLPVANPFPTSIIWWVSSAKTQKIVERTLTWSGVNLTVDEWKIYDTDGTTLLVTVSDAISYSGVFETTRTRTITVA